MCKRLRRWSVSTVSANRVLGPTMATLAIGTGLSIQGPLEGGDGLLHLLVDALGVGGAKVGFLLLALLQDAGALELELFPLRGETLFLGAAGVLFGAFLDL